MNQIRPRKLSILLIMAVAGFYGCHQHDTDHNRHIETAAPNQATEHSHNTEASNHPHRHEDEDHGLENPQTEKGPDHLEKESAGHDTTDSHSNSDWEELVGIETVKATVKSIEQILSVPGKIMPNPDHVAVISPFIESSVNRVFVNTGQRVQKGDLLVCLSSPEIGILRAEYDKAEAELDLARQILQRQEKLFTEKIISNRAFQEATLALKVAEVNFNYAEKKLMALGIKPEELNQPPEGHSNAVGSTIHVYAPISGVVTGRQASIGQKVNSATKMFELIDLSEVWLEADIFEKDLTQVKVGQKLYVSVSAYPDQSFSGKIFYIGSTLTPETKTIKILAEIKNQSESLKPGMFARTRVVVGEKNNVLVIPKKAILEDENLHIVFVKEETDYHRHVVKTGIISEQMVEIIDGLTPGAEVVTRGNYQLKSRSKMSRVDPHAGHSH